MDSSRVNGWSNWPMEPLGQAFLVGFLLALSLTSSAASTNALYVKLCAPCHGKDGMATSPIAKKLGVKPLGDSKLEDADIARQILEGKLDPKKDSKMPAFKDRITQAELESLITAVKELRDRSPK